MVCRSIRVRSFLFRPSLLVAIIVSLLSSILPLVGSSTALAAGTPVAFKPAWVESFRPTHLWSAPGDPAVDYGEVPQWSYLLVVARQTGPRLSVYVPWTKNYAFVDANSVGPSGPPPATWLTTIEAPPIASGVSVNWQGRVIAAGLQERQAPSYQAPVRQSLPGGTPVEVVAWVMGDELTYGHWTWGRLADGGYAYGDSLQVSPPASPPAVPTDHPSGRWIDVNLIHQTAVAYENATAAHLAIVSTGSPGWETPAGLHQIWGRVADETMNGASLSHLGLDAWHAARTSYDLEHVLFTQYFDGSGDALHENYWLPAADFGVPHSHGCVGLQLADAQWFWSWAAEGVPVLVH